MSALRRAREHAAWRATRGDRHARERREVFDATLQAILVRKPPPGILVDAGGGDGAFTRRAAAVGYRAVNVDLLPYEGLRASFEALPIRSADAIVFTASLHYSDDPAVPLRQAARALRAGGIACIGLTPIHADERAAERAASTMRGRIAGYRHLTRAELVAGLSPFSRIEWLPAGFRPRWTRRFATALRPGAYAEFPMVVAHR